MLLIVKHQQHKSFNILKLENGHFAAQPNNRVIFYDKSYTPSELKFPDFKVSTIEYSVEGEQKWTAVMTINFFMIDRVRKCKKNNGVRSVFNKDKN